MNKVALREVAPAVPAKQIPQKDRLWLLTLDQIESGTGNIVDPKYGPPSEAGGSTLFFDTGNVLYSKLRPYLNKVICPDEPGIATTELVPLRPSPEVLDRKYLCYYLRSNRFVSWVSSQVSGAKMPRVSMKVLWEHQIPLPPLPEQKRIAAILDKADAIRRKRQQSIQLLDDLLKSTFLDMFGDPVTNPKGWEIRELRDYAGFITSGSRGWAKYYSDSGARFIRSLDVQMNEISSEEPAFVDPPNTQEANRTRVHGGDVLLTITGSKIGRAATVPPDLGEAYVSQHVCVVRLLPGLLPRYLSSFLAHPSFGQRIIQQNQYGQTKPGLSLDQIKGFRIPVPPVSIQEKFLRFDSRARDVVGRTDDQAVTDLFESLCQQAFGGDLL